MHIALHNRQMKQSLDVLLARAKQDAMEAEGFPARRHCQGGPLSLPELQERLISHSRAAPSLSASSTVGTPTARFRNNVALLVMGNNARRSLPSGMKPNVLLDFLPENDRPKQFEPLPVTQPRSANADVAPSGGFLGGATGATSGGALEGQEAAAAMSAALAGHQLGLFADRKPHPPAGRGERTPSPEDFKLPFDLFGAYLGRASSASQQRGHSAETSRPGGHMGNNEGGACTDSTAAELSLGMPFSAHEKSSGARWLEGARLWSGGDNSTDNNGGAPSKASRAKLELEDASPPSEMDLSWSGFGRGGEEGGGTATGRSGCRSIDEPAAKAKQGEGTSSWWGRQLAPASRASGGDVINNGGSGALAVLRTVDFLDLLRGLEKGGEEGTSLAQDAFVESTAELSGEERKNGDRSLVLRGERGSSDVVPNGGTCLYPLGRSISPTPNRGALSPIGGRGRGGAMEVARSSSPQTPPGGGGKEGVEIVGEDAFGNIEVRLSKSGQPVTRTIQPWIAHPGVVHPWVAADDGYRWRKYGQKAVKGCVRPRSYHRCAHPGCPVKKIVKRTEDGMYMEKIVKGSHNHPKPPQRRRRDLLNMGFMVLPEQFEGEAMDATSLAEEEGEATSLGQLGKPEAGAVSLLAPTDGQATRRFGKGETGDMHLSDEGEGEQEPIDLEREWTPKSDTEDVAQGALKKALSGKKRHLDDPKGARGSHELLLMVRHEDLTERRGLDNSKDNLSLSSENSQGLPRQGEEDYQGEGLEMGVGVSPLQKLLKAFGGELGYKEGKKAVEGEGEKKELKRVRLSGELGSAVESGSDNEGRPRTRNGRVREPRRIMRTDEFYEDGYKWRKYGQKSVKGNPDNPRSYYKCTYKHCQVRKYVERSPDDKECWIVVYEGNHCHKLPPARYADLRGHGLPISGILLHEGVIPLRLDPKSGTVASPSWPGGATPQTTVLGTNPFEGKGPFPFLMPPSAENMKLLPQGKGHSNGNSNNSQLSLVKFRENIAEVKKGREQSSGVVGSDWSPPRGEGSLGSDGEVKRGGGSPQSVCAQGKEVDKLLLLGGLCTGDNQTWFGGLTRRKDGNHD